MKEHEVKEQMQRVSKYRELETLRNQAQSALEAVTKPWPDGPCGQGPFTVNTRESRQVLAMHISFSSTRGGAPMVETRINNMHIEAHELGRALEVMLQARVSSLNAQMENV